MITSANANKILQLYTADLTQVSLTGQGVCYIGFSSTTPAADGSNFTEPTGTNYARIRMNKNSVKAEVCMWGTIANGEVSNAKEVVTRECQDSTAHLAGTEDAYTGWAPFTHYGIFDCETGGVPLVFNSITDPVSTVTADIGNSTGITAAEVTKATFVGEKGEDDATYIFSYDGTDWLLDGSDVTLSTYGITATGTAVSGDKITVTVNHPEKALCIKNGNVGLFRVGAIKLKFN